MSKQTVIRVAILLALLVLVPHARAQQTADRPTIFVCGDSTSKNSGAGKSGEPMAGWGTPIASFFEPQKVAIKNVGHGGRSSRTYYEGDWPVVLPQIKAGDYVLLVFGINDGATPAGLGDEVVTRDGKAMHTYGWYMSRMVTDAREKGAHVYLLTLTARNIWTNPKVKFQYSTPVGPLPDDYDPKEDRIERGAGGGRFNGWTKEIGQRMHVPVLDLNNLAADRYEAMGREAVNPFYSDVNHTYIPGAELVAETIVSGLKAFKDSPFVPLLSEKGREVSAADPKYVIENRADGAASASLPPLEVSDVPRATQMGTAPGPQSAPGNGRYSPPMPANDKLPTLWLIGDSTVRNGFRGDGTNLTQWGWGGPLVAYFDADKINVVNRAFGGTSSRSFYTGFFWQHIKLLIKPGDFVILQFGANDNGGASGKGALRGVGLETAENVTDGKTEIVHTFGWYLRQYVKEIREQGAIPIICSLTPRKIWTPEGRFHRDNQTHVAWAAQAAREENALYIDLYELIAQKYENLGTKKVDALFVPSPTERLHTGWVGAIANAECVVAGLRGLPGNPLAPFLSARGLAVAPHTSEKKQ